MAPPPTTTAEPLPVLTRHQSTKEVPAPVQAGVSTKLIHQQPKQAAAGGYQPLPDLTIDEFIYWDPQQLVPPLPLPPLTVDSPPTTNVMSALLWRVASTKFDWTVESLLSDEVLSPLDPEAVNYLKIILKDQLLKRASITDPVVRSTKKGQLEERHCHGNEGVSVASLYGSHHRLQPLKRRASSSRPKTVSTLPNRKARRKESQLQLQNSHSDAGTITPHSPQSKIIMY
jgi:hypothetical protein